MRLVILGGLSAALAGGTAAALTLPGPVRTWRETRAEQAAVRDTALAGMKNRDAARVTALLPGPTPHTYCGTVRGTDGFGRDTVSLRFGAIVRGTGAVEIGYTAYLSQYPSSADITSLLVECGGER